MHPRRRTRTTTATVASLGFVLVLLVSGVPLAGHAFGTTSRTPVISGLPLQLLLRPDGANGMDAFILNTTPDWNYGDNATAIVGRDASNASLARSLLAFDLSSLPSTASILGATLALFQDSGGAGTVDVRPANAPWTEGFGGRAWIRIPVTVSETAGVPRTLEPVSVSITFPAGTAVDPQRDVHVVLGTTDVPSQVLDYQYTGANLTGARVIFPATVGAFQSKMFYITVAANGTTAIPSYRTRTWGTSPLWTFGPTGTGASGVSVSDLDGDGKLDVVFGGQDGYLYALNETGKQKWATRVSTLQALPYTPQVADIDGDGRPDVVVFTDDPSVVRLNSTGGVVWTHGYTVGNLPYSTPTLVDVNGDGVLDVLIGGKSNQVDALDGVTGNVILSFPAGASTFTSTIADTNGDGLPEIFFGSDDRVIHSFEVNGTQRWALSPAGTSFLESSVAIGDVNGDGAPDAVTGDDVNNGVEFALRAIDGANVWSVPLPSYRIGGQTLADLTGDGIPEILVGLYSGPMYALRGANGTILWTYSSGTSQSMSPAFVDLDRDGNADVVYLDRDSTTVRVLSRFGALLHSWTVPANDPGLRTPSQLPMATPAVADLDGDGTMEVIVPTGSGVYAFGTGNLDRDWRTWGYNRNHTHRAFDGNSPDGAPFLQAGVGPLETYPALGASWNYRNGVSPWATSGGDFGLADTNATAAPGSASWNVTRLVADWQAGVYPNVGVFLTEADEVGGSLHRFATSDTANVTRRPLLAITYTFPSLDAVPHIQGSIPDMVRTEDDPGWTIGLTSLAADADTSLRDLRWNVSGFDPTIVRITGLNTPGNHNLTYYLQKDAWGSAQVRYWLTDPEGHFASQAAWVNITPVNDAPTFNPPATLIVHYNQTYTFDFRPYIADVDTPIAQLRLSSDDPVGAAVSGFNVSFYYTDALLNQWVFVTLAVTDGSASIGRVVAVKVTEDQPPVLTRPLPDVTLTEGDTLRAVFDLDDYFTDPNNDALFFSYGYSHLNITILANHSVDIQGEAEWTGMEFVTFRGSDPSGATAEDTIVVTVLPVNDPPTIGPVPDLRVHFDLPYSFNLEPYLEDPDTPIDQLAVTASDPFVSVPAHLLIVRYPAAMNGTVQNVTITVSDGYSSASRTIRITVGDDFPPILTSKLSDRFFPEDTVLSGAYNLSRFFSDPDSAPLFYSSGNQNVRITIDLWGSVDLSATANWDGTERVTFRATDDLGALAEDTVWITVLPVDDAAFLRPVPAQVYNTTAVFLDLSPYLVDIDNATTDLSIRSLSGLATGIGRGLLFNFPGDLSAQVEVEVSDGIYTTRASISVTVVLPAVPGFPAYVYWLPIPLGALAFAAFVLYRRRQIEWVFLVTHSGLLVSSVSRNRPSEIDSDLVSSMLTGIMRFASESFSDEKDRYLDGLTLGDRQVALVRGRASFLAVVYRGRTPGFLPRIMHSLLETIEARHEKNLQDIVETSHMTDIPVLLQRLVTRGWWPFVSFKDAAGRDQPA